MYNIFEPPSLSAAQFYGEAAALERRGERCRDVARTLETRRAALTERHQPVLELHNEQVWQGRAATASRQHLQRVTGLSLYLLGLDLAATSRALVNEASALSQEAVRLRSQARAAEATAAAAAAAANRDETTPRAFSRNEATTTAASRDEIMSGAASRNEMTSGVSSRNEMMSAANRGETTSGAFGGSHRRHGIGVGARR